MRRIWNRLRETVLGLLLGGQRALELVLEKLNIRIAVVVGLTVLLGFGLIYRLFMLQIVNGESYLNSFQLRIRRDVPVSASRGRIMDRNGKILAYNRLSYDVTLIDAGESSADLNGIIEQIIDIVERNGSSVTTDFGILYDSATDSFVFRNSGSALIRFLADVYGHPDPTELEEEERNATAEEVMRYLCGRDMFRLGTNVKELDGTTSFVPMQGYDRARLLKIVTIRYLVNLNRFQKYVPAVIATDVTETCVAAILESANLLAGVDISEGTYRVYNDSKYFAQILGYTGRVSSEELETLKAEDDSYTISDVVGKSGIEKSMESYLRGTKGTRSIYVDIMGRLTETISQVPPVPGNDVYLTIDADLQKAAYDILEKKLADILLSVIQPIKEYIPEEDAKESDIRIPIYDVYFTAFNNNLIDTSHFLAEDASPTEKAVQAKFLQYRDSAMNELVRQLSQGQTIYSDLSREWKEYESYIVQYLKDNGVLDMAKVDTDDALYQNWTTEETISIEAFLRGCIAKNWIDSSRLVLPQVLSTSDEVYQALNDWLLERLPEDPGFAKKLYHNLLLSDIVTGREVCILLTEQGLIDPPEAEYAALLDGAETPYQFLRERIAARDLTPAELALDPYSGSMVITDVNTGDVLAMISYPGYDNNMMANTVDPVYFEKLRNDLSMPFINYATHQRTAPGSTFKMISATAGLMEGAVTPETRVYCSGTYLRSGFMFPQCWIHPNGHGMQSVSEAIRNSCNVFFYEVGYQLSLEDGQYNSAVGVEKLAKYADMYGLTDKSGIEIDEYPPLLSDMDSIRSAIGQGTASFTTVQLARYITTVANSGTCFDLTLIDRAESADGIVYLDNSAKIRNVINMDPAYWDLIHRGMRGVVQNKWYFSSLPVHVAGKTGTAQESANRPNHALFLCYAPYENPQIAVATRIAYGYSSDYAAQTTNEVLKYYYDVETLEKLVTTEEGMEVSTGGD